MQRVNSIWKVTHGRFIFLKGKGTPSFIQLITWSNAQIRPCASENSLLIVLILVLVSNCGDVPGLVPRTYVLGVKNGLPLPLYGCGPRGQNCCRLNCLGCWFPWCDCVELWIKVIAVFKESMISGVYTEEFRCTTLNTVLVWPLNNPATTKLWLLHVASNQTFVSNKRFILWTVIDSNK